MVRIKMNFDQYLMLQLKLINELYKLIEITQNENHNHLEIKINVSETKYE